ncbi:hypothetical protein Jiend_08910 [Micromonospora endophytica]|nr:hypothetical protein Jiend_08910 [Micromonospora endophytica]
MANALADPESGLTPAQLAARHGLRMAGERPSLSRYTRQLWQYRHFISAYSNAKLTASFSNARLGQLWQVLTPLTNAAVYFLIFGVVLQQTRGWTTSSPTSPPDCSSSTSPRPACSRAPRRSAATSA